MIRRFLFLAFVGISCAISSADDSVVSTNEATKVDGDNNAQENSGDILDGICLAIGLGGSFYENRISDGRQGHAESNVNRLLGVLALGIGKAFNESFYVGAEMLCDFSRTKNKHMKLGNLEVDAKASSVSPSLGIRLGYLNRSFETLFYAKIAASHALTTFRNDNYDVKVAKIAPAVAFGVERAFSKKFSARLECEYRFSSSKTFVPATEIKVKSARGINVRALVAYHINSNPK